MSWGNEPQAQVSEVTLKELTTLCDDYRSLRVQKDEVAKKLKDINKEIAKKEAKIVEYLDEYGMSTFSGRFGKVTRNKKTTFKLPSTESAEAAFHDWLRSKGDYDKLAKIAANSMNSYVKAEVEAQRQEGNYGFIPPGLEPPNIHYTISYSGKGAK